MKASIDLVIFDMAGTTVQDRHEVEMCLAQAAQATGLTASQAEILALQGWSKRQVFEVLWEKQRGRRDEAWEASVKRSYAAFQQVLEEHYRTQPVFPTVGTVATLQALRTLGIPVALTTGFYRRVADLILGRLGWLASLDAGRMGGPQSLIRLSLTSDEVARGRPAPDLIQAAMQRLSVHDPKRVVKVGDTPSDLQAGRAAGCGYVIGLTNGTHHRTQLQNHDHDVLLDSMPEVIPWLQEQIRLKHP